VPSRQPCAGREPRPLPAALAPAIRRIPELCTGHPCRQSGTRGMRPFGMRPSEQPLRNRGLFSFVAFPIQIGIWSRHRCRSQRITKTVTSLSALVFDSNDHAVSEIPTGSPLTTGNAVAKVAHAVAVESDRSRQATIQKSCPQGYDSRSCLSGVIPLQQLRFAGAVVVSGVSRSLIGT
jgi:hypothetical protein